MIETETAMFKICNSCTPRYQKPISASKRICPACGAKGRYAFRSPTEQEVQAETARRAKSEAFLQELLKEAE